ncbi:phosphoribosyltransferase [Sulfurospirillum sp. T05]|uniref:Phosphoribosyltransferase n=1 Tax=Sulfurospirillum tamanense TaxID=2813362 RepID=A0ABS2WTS9_9BACT|nr:phosphoribosyltransferase [Sulfurospirillum tamanensis]
MQFYSYEEFCVDVNVLAKEVKASFAPEAIVAIARGGMTLGHFLAEALEMRDLYAINSIHYEETRKLDTIEVFNVPNLSKVTRVLVVDDIIDSGETMIEIKRVLLEKYPHIELKVAAVFYKEKALLRPDFAAREATQWIKFFWDFEIDGGA